MKIIIVDDDKLVVTSLKTIIEMGGDIEVAGIGYNGNDAIALVKALHPDILLMDIRMEIMTGLEAGEIILNEYPATKLLFLTTFSDDDYIVRALKIGAKGYLLKQNYEMIIPSLKAVYLGQSVFGDTIITKIPELMGKKVFNHEFYHLSEKEMELVKLVADGLSNKEIASQLYLSEGTVRNSISVILDKLTLRDRTQLAIFYYRNMS